MNWDKAISHFRNDLRAMKNAGRLDSELETRVLLAAAQFRNNGDVEILRELKTVKEVSAYPRVRKLHPIVDLATFEMDQGIEAENCARLAVETLWNENRFLDLLVWVPYVLPRFDSEVQMRIRKKLLSAVEKVLNSLDDAHLRKQFLSFPRTQDALQALKR